MEKSKNYNHPVKGSTVKVEPIKRIKDIETIKKLLRDRPRDSAIFIIGINTNLRAIDLCSIKAGQIRGLKPMDSIEIRQKRNGV